METFPLGATIRLRATFKINGVLSEPTTATCTVRKPDGTTTSPTVATDTDFTPSTGRRFAGLVCDQVGRYAYRFSMSNASGGTVNEDEFLVRESRAL